MHEAGDVGANVQPLLGGLRMAEWLNLDRGGFLLLLLAIAAGMFIPLWMARQGRRFYVRPIAALQALEDAVGRCTEMGRPVLFVPGVMDLNEIQTVAGVTVLSHVAKFCAEFDTPILIPTARTLVMAACRETVEGACLAAGRPEAYNADAIQYVTDEQFGYVAHVCGTILRDKPAACFYLGQFFAESLLLAETGHSVGAIQISGTAETSQLPFFVAASDFTLLGEELFAASAYLSGSPEQLSTLKGQDVGKLLALSLMLTGVALATLNSVAPDWGWPQACLQFLTTQFLK